MWIVLALSAATLWGLTYAVAEQLYRSMSALTLLTVLCGGATVVMTIIGMLRGDLPTDLAAITASRRTQWLLGLELVAFIGAELCIAFAITSKNATLASLIEISYPLFIVAWSLVLFRKADLTPAVGLGALLIMAGAMIVATQSHR